MKKRGVTPIPVFCLLAFFLFTRFAGSPAVAPAGHSLSNPVQFAVPGDFLPPFEHLNDIPPGGLDLDLNGTIDIIHPCSCRNQLPVANGANPNNALFDDQVVVATGVSGQQWRIQNSENLLSPSNFSPIAPGTIIPEVGNTGVYVLKVVHRDAHGYFAMVEAPTAYPGQVFGPVLNTCYYPDPYIENLESSYCDSDPNIVMLGTVTSDFDDNFLPLTPVSELWTITRQSNGQTYTGAVFSPSNLGPGVYTVRYTVDMGGPAHGNFHQTGCTITAQMQVTVWGAHPMACNSAINVTLPPTSCQVTIVPAMLLSVNPGNNDNFQIDVLALNGESLGNVIPASFAGIPLSVRIEDLCSGDFCFTTVTVNDFAAPQLTIPPNITIACYEEPETSLTGVATATDCSPFTVTYTDQTVMNGCGNPVKQVFRTWKATDSFGNSSMATQTISIAQGTQSQLLFPPDVVYSCEEYQADPSIIDATAQGAGFPTPTESLCGFLYAHSDMRIDQCGNPDYNFSILRTWLVLDNCGNVIYETDGAGNDNIQLIRVVDNNPPQINADPIEAIATLSPQDNGLGACSSVGFIPPPSVVDGCNNFHIRIFTPLGEAVYVNGVDGTDGGFIPAPGLQLGAHQITYEARDDCDNTASLNVEMTITDGLPPVMICDNQISLTLSANGSGIITPANIDSGSRDECCLGDFKIKFLDEPDSLFRDFIELNCIQGSLQVVLRVWDCAGNHNDCISTVMVNDPVPVSVVQGVQNVSLTCLDDYSDYLQEDFDAPVFADNCDFTVSFSAVENIDSCGVGTLVRTWTAQDHPGNPPAIVEQTVTFSPVFEYHIDIPSDIWTDCANINFQEPTFEQNGCGSITHTVQEDIVSFPIDSACYRIIRTHTITNWCEYDGISPPFLLPRWDGDDPDQLVGDAHALHSTGGNIYRLLPGGGQELVGASTGNYQYQQMIMVFDSRAPAVEFVTPDTICTAAGTAECAGELSFTFTATDDCDSELEASHRLIVSGANPAADPFGTLSSLGDGAWSIQGNYPVGDYTLILDVSDGCGNLTTNTIPFIVRDCTPPALICAQDLSFTLDTQDFVELQPADLIVQGEDNCPGAKFSFTQEGVLQSLFYDCDSLGERQVVIWATDVGGNQVSCTAGFTIINGGACGGLWTIDGQVRTPPGMPVGGVEVGLTGPAAMEDQTQPDGWYEFASLPNMPGYKVNPGKNTGHGNGLSTLDLILINKHILFVEPLDSPYKIIAADANRSGNVSTLDLIQIRKIILGVDTAFAQNTSWRFVPESYLFDDPANPLAENFPEDVTLAELAGDTTINFIAIKTGDVNYSADPSNLNAVEERGERETMMVFAESGRMNRGEERVVRFNFEEENVLGFQFTLHFDPEKLKLLDILPEETLSAANFGQRWVDDGVLTVSWNGEGPPPGFGLRFLARTEVELEEALWLNSSHTPAEGYRNDSVFGINATNLHLLFTHSQELHIFVVFPNRPNPFGEFTDIEFHMPASGAVQLEIMDANGRLVEARSENFDAGRQRMRIEGTRFPEQTLLFYRLTTAFGSASGKMIRASG
jgi:hypothetical protein